MIYLSKNNFLGKTQNGLLVFDRIDSHFHFEGGLTIETLKEGLAMVNFPYKDNFYRAEIVFDNFIGYSQCVKIDETDKVKMYYRKGREGKTPMVFNRKPEPSKILTIVLQRYSLSQDLVLVTAFIGGGSTPEPWDKKFNSDPKGYAKSVEYWKTHALIYREDLIDQDRNK